MNTTTRHFEFKDDRSSKFWEIAQSGESVTVQYGKTGTAGRSQTTAFEDTTVAARHMLKLITEKLGNGYVEQSAAPVPAADTVTDADVKQPDGSKAKKTEAKANPVKPAKLKNPALDPDAAPENLLALLDKDDATNRLLAKHPRASSELLERLSHSSDMVARKSVCLNPNTSKDILIRLAPQFPGDFFLNPAFDWLLLEDPDLLFQLGMGVLKNILKRPDCPQSFLQWAVKHGSEQEQLAVAMNPSASEELIVVLAKNKGSVAEAAKGHSKGAKDIEIDLDQTFREEVGKALADLEFDEVKSAWKRGLIGPAQWQALNFVCRVNALGLETSVIVTGALPEAAQLLSGHSDQVIRYQVAGHQATPVEILNDLASDKDPDVRCELALNTCCLDDIMAKLSVDKNPDVRAAIARNRKVTPDKLNALAADRSPEVRLAVTESARTSLDLLNILSRDLNPRVRKAAAVQLKRLGTTQANPQTPAEQLTELATSKSGTVRCAVAANPSAPETALRLLTKNANAAIWQALAKNPSSPDDLFELAYRNCVDTGSSRLIDFVTNPDCPTGPRNLAATQIWKRSQPWDHLVNSEQQRLALRDASEEIARLDEAALVEAFRKDCLDILHLPTESCFARSCGQLDVLNLGDEHVSACSASTVRAIRLIGLTHRKAAPDVLAKRSKSTDWVERLAISRNPSTPPNVLKTLKNDPHKVVARQAQATKVVMNQDKLRLDSMLYRTVDSVDLNTVVKEIYERLRLSCRHFQVADSLWWEQLSIDQRIGCSNANFLSDSALPLEFLATVPSTTIRRSVAGNSGASALALEMLAKDSEKSIRRSLAGNRSTPVSVLALLAQDPDQSIRKVVAGNEGAPGSVLEALSKDDWRVSIAVAANPGTPPSALTALASQYGGVADGTIRYALINNPQTPFSVLEAWAKSLCFPLEENSEVNTNFALDFLEILIDRVREYAESWYSRSGAKIDYPNTSLRNLIDITAFPVATNPHIFFAFLEKFLNDSSVAMRFSVAGNSEAPESILEVRARDKEKSVRVSVAGNIRTPVGVLDALARDQAEIVRFAIAKNPQAPVHVLETLANDPVVNIRWAVATHSKTPPHVLESLAKNDSWLARAVAMNSSTPEILLRKLAEHNDYEVRQKVASNRSCPWQILRQLSTDKKVSVSRLCSINDQVNRYFEHMTRIAEDTQTPQKILGNLAAKGYWSIRFAALNNPAFPRDEREAGLKALWSEVEVSLRAPETPPAQDAVTLFDIAMALDAMDLMPEPNDKKAIAAAAKSKDLLARVGAILTSGIQPSLLRLLLDDEVQAVHELAAQKLKEAEAV